MSESQLAHDFNYRASALVNHLRKKHKKNIDFISKIDCIKEYHTNGSRVILNIFRDNICNDNKLYSKLKNLDYKYFSCKKNCDDDAIKNNPIFNQLHTLFKTYRSLEKLEKGIVISSTIELLKELTSA